MADTTNVLILTFAEIEFLLRSAPHPDPTVRERLHLGEQPDERIVAAGVASLLARGLCVLENATVVPGRPIVAVIAGLSGPHSVVEVLGWRDDLPVVLHLLTGETVRLALFPAAYGQFTVEVLDPAEPVSAPVLRFLDACTPGGVPAAVAIRTANGGDRLSIAVAVDETGQWHVSDTERNPDRGEPMARTAVTERIRELLDRGVVGTARP